MKTSWSWTVFLHLSLSSVDCAGNSACDIQLKNKVPGMKTMFTWLTGSLEPIEPITI